MAKIGKFQRLTSAWVDDRHADCTPHSLCGCEGKKLLTGRTQVNFDGSAGDTKDICDVLLGLAGRNPLQDFFLAFGQMRVMQELGKRLSSHDVIMDMGRHRLDVGDHIAS